MVAAVRKGWRVEVWSWSSALSDQFDKLASENPDQGEPFSRLVLRVLVDDWEAVVNCGWLLCLFCVLTRLMLGVSSASTAP